MVGEIMISTVCPCALFAYQLLRTWPGGAWEDPVCKGASQQPRPAVHEKTVKEILRPKAQPQRGAEFSFVQNGGKCNECTVNWRNLALLCLVFWQSSMHIAPAGHIGIGASGVLSLAIVRFERR